ncbi:hypothetical protein VTN00DRAFT_8058 [Thermoascus crustaceus]|uniref:uncharacterized protein n=1 Tax=Thermoascus crustaceus TaxID=5088 RepID=UPI003743BE1A
MAQEFNVRIPTVPAVIDHIQLRDIQLPLPMGPDPWHRPRKPQPCTASIKLSYSSAIAAAAADDVALSLDYGKLYRRVEAEIREAGHRSVHGEALNVGSIKGGETKLEDFLGEDVRRIAGLIADCGFGLLDETVAGVRRMSHSHQSLPVASTQTTSSGTAGAEAQAQTAIAANAPRPDPIDSEYAQCEVWLHLPKALLRAEGGLKYRSVTVWGYKEPSGEGAEAGRQPMVLEQEFRIEGIRSYCILGVNSHERLEKQAVIISLEFKGPGQLSWGSTVVKTYQEMARVVAERVEETSYQTVEALATFIARIVTVEFGNERVTVTVEKPSALAFVERAGVEITRSQAFFAQQDYLRMKEGIEPSSR